MTTPYSKFSALYYPYSRLLYETDLKRLALVFDELLFVDPLSADILFQPAQGITSAHPQALIRNELDSFGHSLLDGRIGDDEYKPVYVGGKGAEDTLCRWYNIAIAYKTLKNEGIVKLVSSAKLIKPYESVVSYAILRDLCQCELASTKKIDNPANVYTIIGQPSTVSWLVHESRLPPTLDNLITNSSLVEQCLVHLAPRKMKSKEYRSLVDGIQREWKDIEPGPGRSMTTPYHIGLFAVLNQALLLSEKLEASLVTDDPFIHQVLTTKLRELQDSSNKFTRDILATPAPEDRYRVQSFVLSVVSQLVPDEVLSQLDMADIVAYRKKNADTLNRFRMEMTSLAASISTEPWSSGFQSAIQRTIDSQIMPRVQELDDSLKDSFTKLFGSASGNLGSAVATSVAAALPTMTVAALLGITAPQIVMLTAASLMSALGIVVPDIVKFWQDKNYSRRNGIGYLVNFRNRLTNRLTTHK
jgi:hypothetical protein